MALKKRVAGFLGGASAAALVASGLVSQPAVSETPASATWNFASDFTLAKANPVDDAYGNAEVWTYMAGTPGASDGYTPLPNYNPPACSNGAVTSWTISGEPWIAKNHGAESASCGTPVLPAGSGAMNPSASHAAILRWASPVSGKVAVTGGVTDADPGGGDGIAWGIYKNDTLLASGSFLNGGSQTFANGTGGPSLSEISLTAEDSLYVAVAANGTYFYDSTLVDFTVTWTESPTTTSTTSTSTTSPSTTSTSTTSTTVAPTTTTTTVPASPCARPTIRAPYSARTGPVVYGTEGDDIILGSGGNDRIDGRGGNDIICGGYGKDSIRGGSGNDEIYGGLLVDQLQGGAGNDRIYGEEGNDAIRGDDGHDVLDGGGENDSLGGGNGNDVIEGVWGDDRLSGDAGDDSLNGGEGRDSLSGSTGADRLYGMGGDDRLAGGGQRDECDGGFGRDSVSTCEVLYNIP